MELYKNKIDCCGCSLCNDICNVDAIKMQLDDEGFLYPKIDENKCISCGRCKVMCPMNQIKDVDDKELRKRKVYAAFTKNVVENETSASGGVAAELSFSFINKKGIVSGVKWGKDFVTVQRSFAKTKVEIEAFKSSKYLQSHNEGVWRKLKALTKQNERILFIGLPCEIAAARSYLNKDYKNIYFCELVCAGPTSELVSQNYCEYLKKRYKSNIVYFNVRYKKKGKSRPFIRAVFDNGKEFIRPFYETEYGQIFSFFVRPSCYSCKFKNMTSGADLSIGDFITLNKSEPGYNKSGTSMIIVNTEKGRQLLAENTNIQYYEVGYERINENHCISNSKPLNSKRVDFSSVLIEQGYRAACNKTMGHIRKIRQYIISRIQAYFEEMGI